MFMRVNSKCAQPSLRLTMKAVHRPVRRSHEVAKVEAPSAKADLRELRPASHQVRPPLTGERLSQRLVEEFHCAIRGALMNRLAVHATDVSAELGLRPPAGVRARREKGVMPDTVRQQH